MLALAVVNDRPDLRCGGNTMKEEKMAIITNVRGVRGAWGGMLDGLLLLVHTLGGGPLSNADHTILTIAALRFWPDNAITTMVDRVLTVEDTVMAGTSALKMLADRDPISCWSMRCCTRSSLPAQCARTTPAKSRA